MPGTTDEHLPWNEGSALEELERIKEAIDECRRRRKELQAEFDGFVRSFRSAKERTIVEPDKTNIGGAAQPPQAPPNTAASAAPSVAPIPVPPIAAAPTDHQPQPVHAPFAPPVVESPVTTIPSGLRTLNTDWRTRRMGLLGVGAAVVVVVVAGFMMTRSGSRPADAPASTVANRAAVPVRPAGQSAALPSNPPPAAVDAGPPRSEILAVRRVWVRVVVDGVKTAEREMEAGERVTLAAGSTAAIRAGNAGAVRVTVNGEDRGLLGAEGEVLTRTVRVPAAPR